MVRIVQATDMNEFVCRNEVFDSVAYLSLHIFEFTATNRHLCHDHRDLRHKHKGFSDPLSLIANLTAKEFCFAVHCSARKIL
jgi:hypothetical protein